MEECIPTQRHSRDYLVKFPEELLVDNLGNHMLFAAEVSPGMLSGRSSSPGRWTPHRELTLGLGTTLGADLRVPILAVPPGWDLPGGGGIRWGTAAAQGQESAVQPGAGSDGAAGAEPEPAQLLPRARPGCAHPIRPAVCRV